MTRESRASGIVWRSFREQQMAERPDLPAWQMALKLAVERPRLHKVRNATFDDLSEAGYDVCLIEDGETEFEPPPGEMPERWRKPIRTIVPKVATFRNVQLFKDGSVLLPDGRYCYFDTSFHHPLEDDRNFGALRKVVRRNGAPSGPVSTVFGMLGNERRFVRYGDGSPDVQNGVEIVHFRPAWMNRRVLRTLDPLTGDALIRPSRKRSITVPGRCFSARSCYPDNMGHFMHDILSRIYYEDLGAIAPGKERIIAPRFKFPMQKILFERIFEGYDIVHVPSDATLEVEELSLPANLSSTYRFNAKAISALARRMRCIASSFSGKEKRKVCVSRMDGTKEGTLGRNFVNAKAFEEHMRKLGYHVVEISKLGPDAQFRLWADCAGIVGIHGAGMMNCLMMPEGSSYVEVAGAPFDPLPEKHMPTSVVRCAMAAEHEICGLAGDMDGEGQPFVDLGRLEEMLRRSS